MHWGGGWGVPGDRSRKGRMREVKKEEMGRKEKGKRCMCVCGGGTYYTSVWTLFSFALWQFSS